MAIAKTDRAWFKPFARAGYASRGLVYTVIGIFAVLASIGAGENKSTRDAIATLFDSGFGVTLAATLTISLFSYSAWRVVQSLFDTDNHGYSAKGLGIRLGLLSSAAIYVTLALYTIGVWRGTQSQGGGGSELSMFIADFVGSSTVALTLTATFLVVGGAHIAKAVTRGYAKHFRAPLGAMQFIHPIAFTGLLVRGLVFVFIAGLLFYRGLTVGGDSPTPGVEDVLEFLQGLPAGGILLAAMGIGLIAFAGYSFLQALWRDINVEDAGSNGHRRFRLRPL